MRYHSVYQRIFGFLMLASLSLSVNATDVDVWDIENTGQPSKTITLELTEGTWMSLDVSPDGETIVFDLLGDIYSIPSSGGQAKLIHGGPAMQYAPSYNQDGTKITYLSDISGNTNVWISAVTGENGQQITYEDNDLLAGPVWDPSGKIIAVSKTDRAYPSRVKSTIDFYTVNTGDYISSGRLVVDVPESGRDVQEPEFSPNGQYLFYTERVNNPNIYIDGNHINNVIKKRNLASGVIEEVAGSFGSALTPSVSPDGQYLAFVRRVRDKTILFKLDLSSGQQTPIFDGLDRDLQAAYEIQGNYYPHFSWFPDNRHVAIWAQGKIMKVDMVSGLSAEIPFSVEVEHKVIKPLRYKQELVPETVEVRTIRHIAPSKDGKTVVFTALGTLWYQTGNSAPKPMMKNKKVAFEPKIGADENRVVFVTWDDEQGSELIISSPTGKKAKTVAASLSVIREPSLSSDGKWVTFRIQDADPSMGGGRDKPGIYLVSSSGGQPRFLAPGDAAPIFSPDNLRVYYIEKEPRGDSHSEVLKSITLSGHDVRTHAMAPDADTREVRVSPDLNWIAAKSEQQYYIMPFYETGRPFIIDTDTNTVPVRRLTETGGYALTWSTDSKALHWVLGARHYETPASIDAAAEIKNSSIELVMKPDVPKGVTAFTNARIITMKGDEVIEHGTLVVENNKITAIGKSDDVKIPADAFIVDATDHTIMPGLIDAHSHLDCCWQTGVAPDKKPALYAGLAYGITTAFDPYPNDLTSYENTEATIAGYNVGPRWIGTGSAVWGRARQSSGMYEPLQTYEQVQNLIARKKAVGGTIIKSYRIPSRKERQMLVKAAREVEIMVDAEGESHFYNDITMILDGHTNLEHNMPVATYYDDLVQLMKKADAYTTPTLVVTFGELMGENFMYQTTEAWNDPKVSTYAPETLSGYSPLGTPYGAPYYVRSMTTIQAADEIYDIGFRAVSRSAKKLNDAGVVVNAGSHGEVPGLSQHWELSLLAQGGMSNMEVLRTTTINPAKTLGIIDQVGSLEVGKLADIIVLEKNPLEDIAHTNTVKFTMVNGRLYDSVKMDEIGNHPHKRSKFYWEVQPTNDILWFESAAHR